RKRPWIARPPPAPRSWPGGARGRSGVVERVVPPSRTRLFSRPASVPDRFGVVERVVPPSPTSPGAGHGPPPPGRPDDFLPRGPAAWRGVWAVRRRHSTVSTLGGSFAT